MRAPLYVITTVISLSGEEFTGSMITPSLPNSPCVFPVSNTRKLSRDKIPMLRIVPGSVFDLFPLCAEEVFFVVTTGTKVVENIISDDLLQLTDDSRIRHA